MYEVLIPIVQPTLIAVCCYAHLIDEKALKTEQHALLRVGTWYVVQLIAVLKETNVTRSICLWKKASPSSTKIVRPSMKQT